MRYVLIMSIVLWIVVPEITSGQSVDIRGRMDEDVRGVAGLVYSNQGGGVPYAHVFFIHGKDTIPLVCNAVGAFSWQTARVPDTLQIRVTAVGYKSFAGTYSPKNQGNRLWIRLQQEATALNEVIVTAKKVYMVVKGDTLEYKAESFKTLEGDFIGNLLRKMPGVSFDKGSLTVNGEPIYRIYVNGEDFGGNGAVLSNIRADNVKDIQVYDERNKEDQARGMKHGRRETVMNVITKQKVDRKEWRNGNLLLGTGWDVSDNQTSRFKQKWNLKFNHSVPLRIPEGQSKMNFGKFLNLEGEYKNVGTETDRQLSKFSVDYQNRRKTFFKNKELYYRTLNCFYNDRNYSRELDERVYFPTSDYASRTYTGRKVGETDNWTLSSEHTFAYNRIEWRFNFMSEKQENDRNNLERATTNDTLTSSVNMQYRMKDVFSSGKTKLYFPLMKVFNFSSSFGLGKGKTKNRQIDTLSESSRHVFIEQKYNRQEANWSGRIGYSKTLSLFRLGFGYTYSSSMDKEKGESVNELTSRLDTNGTRDYTFYQHTHSLNGSINMSTKETIFMANMSVERLFRNHIERFPYRKQYQDDFLLLSARLYISTKISPTFNWSLTYDLRPKLPQISKTRREIETSNPLFLQAGNPNLKPSKQHYLNFQFNRMFVSNAIHLKGYMIYELTQDYQTTSEDYFKEQTYLEEYDYTVMAGATLMTWRNTKASHNLTVSMECDKYSGLLESKLNIRGYYKFNKIPSFTRGQANDQSTNSGFLQLRITTAFSRKVEFILNTTTNLSNTRSDLDKASNILGQNSSLNFRTSLIPKLRFSSTFSYNYSKNYATGYENGRPDLRMEIGRNLGQFASIKLEGINLLNRQNGVQFQKEATYTGRTEKARTGRYVMLTFTQKLR